MRLPRIAELDETSSGTGYFLCARKERRTGRNGGVFLSLLLQDVTGEVIAKVFQDVDSRTTRSSRAASSCGSGPKAISSISASSGRRQDPPCHSRRRHARVPARGLHSERAAAGGRDVAGAPRPARRHRGSLAARATLPRWRRSTRIGSACGRRRGRSHHAYRSGLLEHILKITEVVDFLGRHLRRQPRPAHRRSVPARHRQAPGTGATTSPPTIPSKATSSVTSRSAPACSGRPCAIGPTFRASSRCSWSI